MNTRMEKYDPDMPLEMSRQSRNAELYKTINKSELNNYDIKSNATVLGPSNKGQIDVEQIKKILDTRYNELPKRKSIRIDDLDNEEEAPKEESTKEYDINAILEKARTDKPLTYEEERAKKLRDTQFDILKNLDLEKDKEDNTEEETKLLDLINTITINEDKSKSPEVSDALDILSDLKGDDNTVVIEGMKEEEDNTVTISEGEIISPIEKDSSKDEKTSTIEKTFFTKSSTFDKKDFEKLDENEDFDDDKISTLVKNCYFHSYSCLSSWLIFLSKIIFKFLI
jgi:septum formation inhibitor MinC